MSENKNELVSMDVVAMNGKEELLKIYDSKLIEHTTKIQSLRDAGNMTIIGIAQELRKIDDDESYKKAGFKTTAEYANIVFDYKRPTTSLYIKCARAFLNEDDNGKITLRDNLPNFTIGQMIELLPLVKGEDDISEVKKAVANGDINNRLSTKKIRTAVQSLNAIDTTSKLVDKSEKTEKTDTQKAAKLGDYNKEKLPKGADSLTYANTMMDAMMETCDNLAKAMKDIEHNPSCDDKVSKMLRLLTELKAELNK